MISVRCPTCAKILRLRDELAGRRFLCNKCKAELTAPARVSQGRSSVGSGPRRQTVHQDLWDDADYELEDPVPATRRRNQKKKQKRRSNRPDRKANPKRFREYDKIVKEVVVFSVGLGLLAGGFGLLLRFVLFDPAADIDRQKKFTEALFLFAGVFVATGLFSATRSRIAVGITCLVAFVGAQVLLAMSLFGGCLVLVPAIGLVALGVRCVQAFKKHP